MNDLLILYNPYYKSDVIHQHLELLKAKNQVAFGKVKSKINNQIKPPSENLKSIYENASEERYLQVFLSDYANLFVAKVVSVCDEVDCEILPSYYTQKNLEVEKFFLIKDLRELVREDFTRLRDEFLANFTTPDYDNHTYAIYGNSYVYPLIIKQKLRVDYFEEDKKYFLDIYKSKNYLLVQENLVRYVFGKKPFSLLHPNSRENLISAELELNENLQDPLYDFTSVIVKYSKLLEYEIYDFARALFAKFSKEHKELLDIKYSVQERAFTLKDFFTRKPNIGTVNHLLRLDEIQKLLDKDLKFFIQKELNETIKTLQGIRNEAVHAKIPSLSEADELRARILGIDKASIIKNLLLQKRKLNE